MITEAKQLLTGLNSFEKMDELFKSSLDNVYFNLLHQDFLRVKKRVYNQLALSEIAHKKFPGRLIVTDQKTHIALLSEGFFKVITPNGPAYTRNGNFYLDTFGRLLNQGVYPTEGERGAIIIKEKNFNVSLNGEISIKGKKTDKINVYKVFKKNHRISESLTGFEKSAEMDFSIMENCFLLQGALEESNLFFAENLMCILTALEIYKSKKWFNNENHSCQN